MKTILAWLLLAVAAVAQTITGPPDYVDAQTLWMESDVPFAVLLTTANCEPCERMKYEVLPTLRAEGMTVTVVDSVAFPALTTSLLAGERAAFPRLIYYGKDENRRSISASKLGYTPLSESRTFLQACRRRPCPPKPKPVPIPPAPLPVPDPGPTPGPAPLPDPYPPVPGPGPVPGPVPGPTPTPTPTPPCPCPGPVIGPPGPRGPAGPIGPQGPAGPQGKDGKTGKDGHDGKDGRDGKDGKPGKDAAVGSLPGIKFVIKHADGTEESATAFLGDTVTLWRDAKGEAGVKINRP